MEQFKIVVQSIGNWISENVFTSSFFLCLFIYLIHRTYLSTLPRAKRKFKNKDSKQILDFKNGELGKIIGHIEHIKEPLQAPLSGKKCVYYEVIVQYSAEEKSEKLLHETRFDAFYISNNTGKALINMEDAICEINEDIHFGSSWFLNPSELMVQFLEKNHIKPRNFLGLNKSLYFIEKRLEIGEIVGVLGQAFWEASINNNSKIENKKTLTFKSHNQQPLFISDNPKTLKKNLVNL